MSAIGGITGIVGSTGIGRVQAGAKIVLATTGTLGDLHPFIGLALRLQERGYEPVIATSAHYRAIVEGAGVCFHAARPDELQRQRDLGMDEVELTRLLMKGKGAGSLEFVIRRLLLPYLRQNYEDLMQATEGASLVVTSSFAYGATLAAEVRGLPFVNVVLQPIMWMSAADPPSMLRFPWLKRLHPALCAALVAALVRSMDRRVASWAAPVHALRRQLGLRSAALNPLTAGQFSSFGTIALYSSVLGQAQTDWPAPASIAGFSWYDGAAGAALALESRLEEFLVAGPSPLVFALGSQAVLNAEGFFVASVAAARRLRKRAVLLVGPTGAAQLPRDRSADILVARYAPYSRVFPRAEAIIHHGGIGTTAQALRAGRPQLVIPFWGDQFDNAARVARLGVARSLSRKRYTDSAACGELTRLLCDRSCVQRARQLGERVAREDGAAAAAAHIDRLLAPGRQRSVLKSRAAL